MDHPHFWRHFACYSGGGILLALSVVPVFAPVSAALVGAGGGLLALAGTPMLGKAAAALPLVLRLLGKGPAEPPPGPPPPPGPSGHAT